MRILFHVHALTIGGAERQLVYLARGLAKKGWSVHVVTLYPGGPFWDELHKEGRCILHSLNRKGRWDFTVIIKLAKYIERNHIDLVQGWMLPCNSFAAIAAKLAGAPMMMAIRASNMEYGIGGRIYAQADRWVAQWLAERVIFNSYVGRDYYVGLGYPSSKCIVIPNGIPCPDVKYFPEPFAHSPPWRIGMIARLDPMKDHVTMFRAMAILLQKDVPVELHLYGDGDREWKQYLKNQARRLGVDAVIHWHGFVKDVWSVLARLDVVASSSCGEGMSNALLEAMMAARPIVATNVGDARRMLDGEAGQCGMVVPARDSRAMGEAIEAMIRNRSRAVEMGMRAREMASKFFTVEAMVEQYHGMYQRCISNGGSSVGSAK